MADDEFILKLKVDNSELKKAFKGGFGGGGRGGGKSSGGGNKLADRRQQEWGRLEDEKLAREKTRAKALEKVATEEQKTRLRMAADLKKGRDIETRTRIALWNLITGRRGLYRSIGDLNQIFQENQKAFKENVWKFIKAPFGSKSEKSEGGGGTAISVPGSKGGDTKGKKGGKGARGAAGAIAIVAVLLLISKTLKKQSAMLRYIGDATKGLAGGFMDALFIGILMFLKWIADGIKWIVQGFRDFWADPQGWLKSNLIDLGEWYVMELGGWFNNTIAQPFADMLKTGVTEIYDSIAGYDWGSLGNTLGKKFDPNLGRWDDISGKLGASFPGAFDEKWSGIATSLGASFGPHDGKWKAMGDKLGASFDSELDTWGVIGSKLSKDLLGGDFIGMGETFAGAAGIDGKDLTAMQDMGDKFMKAAHMDANQIIQRGKDFGGQVGNTLKSLAGGIGEMIGEGIRNATTGIGPSPGGEDPADYDPSNPDNYEI